MDDEPAPFFCGLFQGLFVKGRKFQNLGEVPVGNRVHHRPKMAPHLGAKRERFVVDFVHL